MQSGDDEGDEGGKARPKGSVIPIANNASLTTFNANVVFTTEYSQLTLIAVILFVLQT